jgi:hypothetical protein
VSCRDDDIPGTVYRELALAAADMRATEDMRATAGMRGSG